MASITESTIAKDLKLGLRHRGLSVFRAEDDEEQVAVALQSALTCLDAKPNSQRS